MSAKKVESKTAATTSEIIAQLKKNSARKGGSRIKNRSYNINTAPAGLEEVRLAPQAIIALGIILKQDKPVMTESEIFNVLEDGVEEFGTTKQTPWKVFQYYRKPLAEAGFIREAVVAAEPVTK